MEKLIKGIKKFENKLFKNDKRRRQNREMVGRRMLQRKKQVLKKCAEVKNDHALHKEYLKARNVYRIPLMSKKGKKEEKLSKKLKKTNKKQTVADSRKQEKQKERNMQGDI